MATVIFDFDSTLVTCESLEEILKTKNLDAQTIKKIEEITSQGMSGKISFLDSLEKRLGVAPLSSEDFRAFGQRATLFLTPGIIELVAELLAQSVDVWIVSGAAREAMLPLANELGIPGDHILGIDLEWKADGYYAGIDKTRPINRSKWEGARDKARSWTSPKIAVGDGITDYALYEHGLVDHFIAFTQNVRRQAIIDKGVPEATTIAELRKLIRELIHGNTFVS